jgi:7-carboxy-7-deazaguanine synthase
MDQRVASRRLRVTEIFYSLQGEARTAGVPTVFVRLTGCPLRCGYCDTEYAFSGGQWQTIDEILARVREWSCRHVCVTGGEPLAQPSCVTLLTELCDAGYEVSLETSGAIDICHVDGRVSRVMDLKTPGSGECDSNLYANIPLLTARDQVKFVITDRADYEWARAMLEQHRLTQRCDVLFSPSHAQLPAATLAGWILADRLPVRFQIQLHKYLWGDRRGV